MSKTFAALVLLVVSMPHQISAQQEVQKSEVIIADAPIMITKTAAVQEGLQSIRMTGVTGEMGEVVFSIVPTPISYGDSYSMLRNPQVQKELELLEDQQQQLRDLQATYSKRLSEVMGAPPQEDGRSKKTIIAEAKDERQKRIGEILLPHQMERLRQVALQMKMRSRGDMETLVEQELAEKLGISEEQKEQIKRRAEEIKVEMEQEIARLKEKARQKLLRELTPQQRKQLNEMLGAEFDDKLVNRRKPVEPVRRSR